MKLPEYRVPLAGSESTALPGFYVSRRVNPSATINLTVVLKAPSEDRLTQTVAEMAAQSPQQRDYLTREQFAADYGADSGDLDKMRQFAARQGLRVVQVNPAVPAVHLRGSAAAMSRAFAMDLVVYKRVGPRGVQRYRGRVGPIYIPAELEGVVEEIMDMDRESRARPIFVNGIR